jgi:hypothetical protein
MPKVFISYRSADSATSSGRIYDHLSQKYGRNNVFKDVNDIPTDMDVADYIQQSLHQCAVVLIVIGSRWTEALTDQRTQRLDDPTDVVHLAIDTAFALGLSVIPLLVDHAHMPEAEALPSSVRRLARINALEVRNDPDFRRDMERVISAINRAFAARRRFGRLFGRGATSQPTKSHASSNPPVHPAVAGTTPRSRGATTGRDSRLPGAAHVGTVRTRRRVLTGTAVLLVLASLAMLFSSRVVSWPSTVMPRVLRATATEQSSILNAPYVAEAPGPCDTGHPESNWENLGEIPDNLSCKNAHLQIADSSGNETGTEFRGPSSTERPSTLKGPFQASLTVYHFAPPTSGRSDLWSTVYLLSRKGDNFMIVLDLNYSDGTLTFSDCQSPANSGSCQPTLLSSGGMPSVPFTVTWTVSDASVSMALTGLSTKSVAKPQGFDPVAIRFSIYNSSGKATSVEVGHFTYTPQN